MTRLWTLGAILVAMMVLSGTAQAATTLEVTKTRDTTWAMATTTETVDGLQIKIYAPNANSTRRSLWQTCTFSGTYAGTHQCGIDSSVGSLADKREGTWVAKVFAGGVRVARTTFTL